MMKLIRRKVTEPCEDEKNDNEKLFYDAFAETVRAKFVSSPGNRSVTNLKKPRTDPPVLGPPGVRPPRTPDPPVLGPRDPPGPPVLGPRDPPRTPPFSKFG